jgi:hypothetical protein
MESLSGFGQAGIRILDCFLPVRELGLGWALESASMADLAGDGITGDLTGTTTMSFTTTTHTYLTAEFSSIATTSITPADFMAGDFTVARRPADEVSARRSMDSRHHTPSRARIPAHLAALITEEQQEASPLAGNRASVEVSMEVEVSTEAEAVTEEVVVTGNSVPLLQTQLMTWRKYHAH